MRQSELFLRTEREMPKDEEAVNARFLTRANFIYKLMAGVYALLPLGYRVKEKVMAIIREEMNALGSAEMLMPALHPRAIWDVTGRWEGLSKIMYQFKDSFGKELGLGPTHEEIIVAIATRIIFSYNDLPLSIYQIQTKFRNEPRAKSGLLRGREFTMKDLYSFHTDEKSLDEFYERAKAAYTRVFERCGLKAYITQASGGDFSKQYSHEFMVISEAGEDETMLCEACGWAQNAQISELKKGDSCPTCKATLDKKFTIEVGNIFRLGTRFSEPNKLFYKDTSGASHSVVMGSYGIGVERLMGTVVEVSHDDAGIIWPEAIAPARIHLLLVGEQNEKLKKFADRVYTTLTKEKVEVLYDDRENIRAGEKFADADLIGIPWRMVVSEKTFAEEKVEVRRRGEKETRLLTLHDFMKAHDLI